MVDAGGDTGENDEKMGDYDPYDTAPVETPKASKSKRRSRVPEVGSFGNEDAILVDAGPSSGPDGATAPDDPAFVDVHQTRKPPMRRSATMGVKRPSEGFMGLFGSFRKKDRERRASDEENERRERRRYTSGEDSGARRKRRSPGYGIIDEEAAKRARRESRRGHHSRRLSDTEGHTTDAAGNAGASASTDIEDAEARRAERRARRARRESDRSGEGELTEVEKRTSRRRDKERDNEREREVHEARRAKAKEVRDRRLREEQDLENRRTEERRARRAARDAEAREAEARDAERRARRREREKERVAKEAASRTRESRPKSGHESRRYDKSAVRGSPAEDDRRARQDLRRSKRSSHIAAEKPTPTRQRSHPIDDYFDSRNGQHSHSHRRRASDNSRSSGEKYASGEPSGRPYLTGGKDKTSSWVQSVNTSPPLPPPIEGTVLDPLPGRQSGDERRQRSKHDDTTTADEDARRERRARRREGERRRERGLDRQIRSSDGSGGPVPEKLTRRRTMMDSPPAADKRSSWLRKIKGF